MEDGEIDDSIFLMGGFCLHTIKIEMTKRARGHHDVRPVGLGIFGMRGDHIQRIFLIDGQNGKAAATGFSGKVNDLCP